MSDNAHSARYFQLEAYTRKVRQITWSTNLRRAAGVTAITDEAAASALEGIAVASLTPAGWESVLSAGLALSSLRTLEAGGWPAVAALWALHGIEHVEVPT